LCCNPGPSGKTELGEASAYWLLNIHFHLRPALSTRPLVPSRFGLPPYDAGHTHTHTPPCVSPGTQWVGKEEQLLLVREPVGICSPAVWALNAPPALPAGRWPTTTPCT
jgi:hypothetical protein